MLQTILHRAHAWKMRRQMKALARRTIELQAHVEAGKRDSINAMLGTIGAFVVLWAYIENAIDLWVEAIHRTTGAAEIQSALPPSLNRELDYLKTAWKTTKVPPSVKEEGERLMAEIHKLKDFRHNLVHGIADLNDPELLVINSSRVKGGARIELKTPYTMTRVVKNATAMAKLRRDLDAFVLCFVQALVEIKERGG